VVITLGFISSWPHTGYQTAGTLSWAVYMLAEHPEIARRLREEIVTQVGLERQPTYPDLRSMKYLRAFVNGESIFRTESDTRLSDRS